MAYFKGPRAAPVLNPAQSFCPVRLPFNDRNLNKFSHNFIILYSKINFYNILIKYKLFNTWNNYFFVDEKNYKI